MVRRSAWCLGLAALLLLAGALSTVTSAQTIERRRIVIARPAMPDSLPGTSRELLGRPVRWACYGIFRTVYGPLQGPLDSYYDENIASDAQSSCEAFSWTYQDWLRKYDYYVLADSTKVSRGRLVEIRWLRKPSKPSLLSRQRPIPHIKGYTGPAEWITDSTFASFDSSTVEIIVNKRELARGLWLPAEHRYARTFDEAAYFTLAATRYWFDLAWHGRPVPRHPSQEDTAAMWQYASDLMRVYRSQPGRARIFGE